MTAETTFPTFSLSRDETAVCINGTSRKLRTSTTGSDDPQPTVQTKPASNRPHLAERRSRTEARIVFISVISDDFAFSATRQRCPGWLVNELGDESYAAIAQQDVCAANVR